MSQPENPIDRLEGISECLRLSLGLDDDAAWLCAAIQDHVRNGTSLDEALGLRGGNGSTARSLRFRRLERDLAMCLREALWHCDGNISELARQVKWFGNNKWPIYRSKPPNPGWSPLLRNIDAAYRINSKLPQTAAGISRLFDRA